MTLIHQPFNAVVPIHVKLWEEEDNINYFFIFALANFNKSSTLLERCSQIVGGLYPPRLSVRCRGPPESAHLRLEDSDLLKFFSK